MTFFKVNCRGVLKHKKPPFESVPSLRNIRFAKLSSLSVTEEELNSPPQRKLLKVAIVGRPNAGKSTLINKILDINLCGVSQKSHTTRTPFKAAITLGETQIVFVDTPGLVTKKETQRFQLPEKFCNWKESVLNEADVVGVIHEATEPDKIFKLHLNLIQTLNDYPLTKPLFLVLNKIDLVIDKEALTAAIDSCFGPKDLSRPDPIMKYKILRKFSRIFFTSAIKDRGISEVIDYLLEIAKPGDWMFEKGVSHDMPLNEIIVELVRSQLLDILPHEIPYLCTYEVEYLKENDIGEVLCVSLVQCPNARHVHLITSGKKSSLRTICRKIESDLYKILGKVFRIRLVVQKMKKGSFSSERTRKSVPVNE